MKFLLRLGITASLIGATLLGSVIAQQPSAIALPVEEVVEKLAPIPVFTVTDQQGAFLIGTGEDNTQVAVVFISQADAQAFVENLKTENTELASKVQVYPIALSKIYELTVNPESNPDGVKFSYVPTDAEVQKAQEILTQAGQEYQGGVPLFVGTTGEEKGYITIEKDGEQLIPFFFEKQQLENMLTKFKEEQPDLASQVEIQVIPLEVILSNLQSSEDEFLKKIILVPTTESIEFIRSNTPSGDNTAPPPPGDNTTPPPSENPAPDAQP